MLEFSIGDLIQVRSEDFVFNQITNNTLEYYSKFYDNHLFEKHGIIIKEINYSFIVYVQNKLYELHKLDLQKVS